MMITKKGEGKMKELVGYTLISYSSNSLYAIYRKIENGRGKWKAKEIETGKVIDITYNQALGYEPINPTPIEQLSMKLGKILLPQH